MGHSSFSRWVSVVVIICLLGVSAAFGARNRRPSSIRIHKDDQTGRVVVSWSGRGVLKAARGDGRFRPVRTRHNSYVVPRNEEQMVFQLASPQNGTVVSVNVVGYVHLDLPPGLSLIANPLYFTNNTVAFWWPAAPDGAQVLKYVPEVGYEVSTFDALAGAWSNPDFEIGIGEGFFFRNTASESIRQTFIGEVLEGTLINPLPAGLSMKGSLVPQEGSINSVHGIPGQNGDVISFYVNDGAGGGDYISSVFSSADGAWVPDMILGVGQGFWIEKQQAQNWVRVFSAH